ncbi:sensor histidine kinase [Pontibacter litorisediminis]|uniref:sensor histidine kinase n=1 Tax=Pontibacter litorisediminis TaxID=1846260 RepID=UPI0023EDEA5D|nr:sensor histidine kinase [Pontibacter litorisediminis]
MTTNFPVAHFPYRRVGRHGLAWAAFIAYEISVISFTSTPQRVYWWEYAGFYLLNILLFYVNAHVVLPSAFEHRRAPWLLLLLLPLLLLLYIALQYGLELFYNLFRHSPKQLNFQQKFIIGFLWRGVYFLGLSATYWLVRRRIDNMRTINRLQLQQLQAQKEKVELEKDLVKSQNAYLQAQINPHFLFNTLNFLYNQVIDVSPKASEGVLLLSEVMRHSLARLHEDGMADVARELEHIRKYIALNQLRFQHPLQLQLQAEGQLQGLRLPPLILLTLVENMFRHGDLTDPGFPASVRLQVAHHTLSFETRNKKRTSFVKGGHHLGLQNARTRLLNAYGPGQQSLLIQEDERYYTVHLQIKAI